MIYGTRSFNAEFIKISNVVLVYGWECFEIWKDIKRKLSGTITIIAFEGFLNIIFHVSGIQQAPAVGRSVMEMILDGGFQTIDLRRMSFDRIVTDMPIFEQNIV